MRSTKRTKVTEKHRVFLLWEVEPDFPNAFKEIRKESRTPRPRKTSASSRPPLAHAARGSLGPGARTPGWLSPPEGAPPRLSTEVPPPFPAGFQNGEGLVAASVLQCCRFDTCVFPLGFLDYSYPWWICRAGASFTFKDEGGKGLQKPSPRYLGPTWLRVTCRFFTLVWGRGWPRLGAPPGFCALSVS